MTRYALLSRPLLLDLVANMVLTPDFWHEKRTSESTARSSHTTPRAVDANH